MLQPDPHTQSLMGKLRHVAYLFLERVSVYQPRLVCQLIKNTHRITLHIRVAFEDLPVLGFNNLHSAWETHRCGLVLHMAGTDRGQVGDT